MRALPWGAGGGRPPPWPGPLRDVGGRGRLGGACLNVCSLALKAAADALWDGLGARAGLESAGPPRVAARRPTVRE